MAITTIFFDAGGTLVFPDLGIIERPLAARGIVPSVAQRAAAERAAKQELDKARADHRSIDAQYWDIYYCRLFYQVGMADDAELRAVLVGSIRKGINWREVRPQTMEILARLKRYYRMGLISNSDGTVRQLFETLGLATYFDSFTDSRLCGFEKPDARIFQSAMASLDAAPQESLFVGDIYSIDFLGAQGAGMSAILMDVSGVYQDSSYPRVQSLAELESHIAKGKAQY